MAEKSVHEAVEAAGALVALLDQAGGAQYGEVVAAGPLRHGQVEGSAGAGPVVVPGQVTQDRPADRVGERVERRLQRHLGRLGVAERARSGGVHSHKSSILVAQ